MNVPLVVGGAAAAAGVVVGVLTERANHTSHEAEDKRITQESEAWLSEAHKAFDGDMTADRLRDRAANDKVEDYKLSHPGASGAWLTHSDSSWSTGIKHPSRDNYFLATVGGGLMGGGFVGGATLGIAHDTAVGAARVNAMSVGAGILGAGLGIAAGSIVSNWTH